LAKIVQHSAGVIDALVEVDVRVSKCQRVAVLNEHELDLVPTNEILEQIHAIQVEQLDGAIRVGDVRPARRVTELGHPFEHEPLELEVRLPRRVPGIHLHNGNEAIVHDLGHGLRLACPVLHVKMIMRCRDDGPNRAVYREKSNETSKSNSCDEHADLKCLVETRLASRFVASHRVR
jgi:hypothetical protein